MVPWWPGGGSAGPGPQQPERRAVPVSKQQATNRIIRPSVQPTLHFRVTGELLEASAPGL